MVTTKEILCIASSTNKYKNMLENLKSWYASRKKGKINWPYFIFYDK